MCVDAYNPNGICGKPQEQHAFCLDECIADTILFNEQCTQTKNSARTRTPMDITPLLTWQWWLHNNAGIVVDMAVTSDIVWCNIGHNANPHSKQCRPDTETCRFHSNAGSNSYYYRTGKYHYCNNKHPKQCSARAEDHAENSANAANATLQCRKHYTRLIITMENPHSH